MSTDRGWCPVCQADVELIVWRLPRGVRFTCRRHKHFSRRVTFPAVSTVRRGVSNVSSNAETINEAHPFAADGPLAQPRRIDHGREG